MKSRIANIQASVYKSKATSKCMAFIMTKSNCDKTKIVQICVAEGTDIRHQSVNRQGTRDELYTNYNWRYISSAEYEVEESKNDT